MYSEEHKIYLKKSKKKKIIIHTCQGIFTLIFIIVWQLLADFNLINTFITSSPKDIILTIINLHNTNNLYNHIAITMYETILSFSLGIIIGLIVATILWWNDFIHKVVEPFLTILNSLPKVALGPLIIIWAGASIKSIILMALLISAIISIINIYQGFISTDPNKMKLMKSFKATKLQIYTKLIFPSSIQNIISTLKINISMSLIGVIMGELLVSKEGLGYLITYGSQVFNLDLVMTGVFVLAIVSVIMYYAVILIEHILLKKITK